MTTTTAPSRSTNREVVSNDRGNPYPTMVAATPLAAAALMAGSVVLISTVLWLGFAITSLGDVSEGYFPFMLEIGRIVFDAALLQTWVAITVPAAVFGACWVLMARRDETRSWAGRPARTVALAGAGVGVGVAGVVVPVVAGLLGLLI